MTFQIEHLLDLTDWYHILPNSEFLRLGIMNFNQIPLGNNNAYHSTWIQQQFTFMCEILLRIISENH